MAGPHVWSWTLLTTALLLSGCAAEDEITPAKIENAYKDADKRYYNSVGGVEDTTKVADVPAGATKLTVKAIYDIGGVYEFTLKNPAGRVEKEEESAGGKTTNDPEWYVTSNPLVGQWRLEIEIAGGGQYAFGFYY